MKRLTQLTKLTKRQLIKELQGAKASVKRQSELIKAKNMQIMLIRKHIMRIRNKCNLDKITRANIDYILSKPFININKSAKHNVKMQ